MSLEPFHAFPSGRGTVGIAFVGCGYASDFYGPTLKNYPHVRLVGAYDISKERAESFTREYGGRVFSGLDEILSDPDVRIVVNLAPVAQHYAINRAILSAGKHVYCEKPMATSLAEAQELVELAAARGVFLSSAPSTVFSAAAQTMIHAVRSGAIGRPRLAYGALDMGPLSFMAYRDWRTPRDVPWPYEDEVRNGCVLEHAGYQLTWMTAMLGPVTAMDSHTASAFGDEWDGIVADPAPDFALGVLSFAGGATGRLTLGWAAPADQSLMIVGNQGAISVADVWQATSPVTLRRRVHTSGRDTGYLAEPEQLPFVVDPLPYRYNDAHDLTVSAGIADLARAVIDGGRPVLSAEFVTHVLDVSLRLAAGKARPDTAPAAPPLTATDLWADVEPVSA